MYANRIYSAVARIREANVCERESDLRRTHPYFTIYNLRSIAPRIAVQATPRASLKIMGLKVF